MTEALTIMTDKALGCVGVIDDLGNLSGIITDGDLRRHMSVDIRKLAVEDVMTKNPLVISKEDLASRALSLMEGKAITNLFVIKDNKPIGIVHIHDILRAGVI
jgi:arabinose-5-phosphate isomerase